MPEEIEVKVRVADPAAFSRRMLDRGLAPAGAVFESNRLFDTPDGRLGREGSALRLREERRPDDGAVLRTVLTFKGPRRPGPIKRRPEFETTVGQAAPAVAILEGLGLAESFRYEKRRTTWHVGECEVVLDQVPRLGWFVEVEGPSEEAVLGQLADLGLGGEPLIGETYVHLLIDCLASLGLDPTWAVFE